MRGFEPELRRLAADFDLPEPIRSRALLELRSDLEDMAAALEAQGVEASEARRRALEALLPSAATVSAWRQVHRPLYQRWVDRFSVRGRHRLERLLLAVVGIVYLGGGTAALVRFDLLVSPSPFLWPVLGLTALIVLTGAVTLFQLFVARGHRPSRLTGALALILGLAGATLAVAGLGVAADLYVVAGRLQADSSGQLAPLLTWLRSEAVLLSTALVAASAAGLIWLTAAVRVAVVEQAEAAALGLSRMGGSHG